MIYIFTQKNEKKLISLQELKALVTSPSIQDDKQPNPAPEWLSQKQWESLLYLSTLPNLESLVEDFRSNSELFRQLSTHKFPFSEESLWLPSMLEQTTPF